MPRQELNVERESREKCKIRKRGCSSSSSSSLVQSYRLKRAVLVGKKGGSSTPVPTWKMSLSISPSLQNLSTKNGGKSKELSVSARKLAATLWEINEVPSPTEKDRSKEKIGSKEKIVKSLKMGSVALHLSDPSHTPVSDRMTQSKTSGHQRKASAGSHKLLLTDYNLGGLDSVNNAGLLMEVEAPPQGEILSVYMAGIKTQLKDVSNRLTTSRELLKVLKRIYGLEEQQLTGLSLISALEVELHLARAQINKLIHEQRSNFHEIDRFLKQIADQKSALRSKEQERFQNGMKSMAGELNVEKKLRRQTERLNKKLGKELAETKTSLSKAVKDLESEKRAREIIEQVCDELARGIGEDRAEVEELKRESAKVREEVEKEREMLQLADMLREERVQLKLTEAKYEFEEKNAVVDKLRAELEIYLRTRTVDEKGVGSPHYDKIKELEEYLRNSPIGSCRNGPRAKVEGEVVNAGGGGEEDSADSDLQSIELNMDNNSKSYEWSYACGDAVESGSKWICMDGKIKGGKSVSERTQRKSTSLEREFSDGIEWELSSKHQHNLDTIDQDRFSELDSLGWKDHYEDEIKRYKLIKDLRDHIVSGSKLTSSQHFHGPTGDWKQTLPSQDPARVVHEGLAV